MVYEPFVYLIFNIFALLKIASNDSTANNVQQIFI